MKLCFFFVLILSSLVSCSDKSNKQKASAIPMPTKILDHGQIFINNLSLNDSNNKSNKIIQDFIFELDSKTYVLNPKFGVGDWTFPLDSLSDTIGVYEKWLPKFKALAIESSSQKEKRDFIHMEDYCLRHLNYFKALYSGNNRQITYDLFSPYYELANVQKPASPEIISKIINNLNANGGFYIAFAHLVLKIVAKNDIIYSPSGNSFGEYIKIGMLRSAFNELSTREDLKEPLEIINKQLDAFEDLVATIDPEVLRKSFPEMPTSLLPGEKIKELGIVREGIKYNEEIYSASIAKNGIDISPKELMQLGQESLERFKTQLAPIKEDISNRELDSHLKKAFTNEIEYQDKLKQVVEDIVLGLHKKDLITLPNDPIRYFYNQNDIKQYGDIMTIFPSVDLDENGFPSIIIPDFNLSLAAKSDFLIEATTHSIMAHEGRPGHELHFTMLNKTTDLIKKKFRINVAFVEGWGLYSEYIASSLLTDSDEDLAKKYFHTKNMILRSARVILDTKLGLGELTREEAIDFLVGLEFSEGYATAEVDRYLLDLGRDGSYYYGFHQFRNANMKLKEKWGSQYSDKCFNDAVMSVGGTYLGNLEEEIEANSECLTSMSN